MNVFFSNNTSMCSSSSRPAMWKDTRYKLLKPVSAPAIQLLANEIMHRRVPCYAMSAGDLVLAVLGCFWRNLRAFPSISRRDMTRWICNSVSIRLRAWPSATTWWIRPSRRSNICALAVKLTCGASSHCVITLYSDRQYIYNIILFVMEFLFTILVTCSQLRFACGWWPIRQRSWIVQKWQKPSPMCQPRRCGLQGNSNVAT